MSDKVGQYVGAGAERPTFSRQRLYETSAWGPAVRRDFEENIPSGGLYLAVLGYAVASYLIFEHGRDDPIYRFASVPRTSLVLFATAAFLAFLVIDAARMGLEALSRLKPQAESTRRHSTLTYRPDVDGLRALAVLGVFAFHLEIPGLPGGFVGVDVFFVISGYLISSFIRHEVAQGTFSWRWFIARRVRRIIPALYLVIATTLIAGTFLYLPAQLSDLSTTALYSVALVQNVYFYMQADYFAAPAEFNALIHLWSLGVEEQFYLLFPSLFGPLLILREKRGFAALLVTLVLLFLGISLVLSRQTPELTFYMVVSRAWEFLIGSTLALGVVPALRNPRLNSVLAATGLAFILASFAIPPGTLWFPAPMALLPCLGTAFIIHAGQSQATGTARFLGSPPLVRMGLLSYSFYLWHWPVYSLYKYYVISDLNWSGRLLVFAVALALSALTYKLVEKPLRTGLFNLRPRLDAGLVGGASAAVFGLAALVVAGGGLPERMPPGALKAVAPSATYEPRRTECLGLVQAQRVEEDALCRFGAPDDSEPSIVVWGDSHAAAVMSAFVDLGRRHGQSIIAATRSSCRPVLTQLSFNQRGDDCHAFNLAVRNLIAEQGITDVILVAKWRHFTSASENYPTSAIRETIENLRRIGVRPWILRQVPFQPYNVPETIARLAMTGRGPAALGQDFTGLSLEDFHAQRIELDQFYESLSAEGVDILDPIEVLCDGQARCPATLDGSPLYRDRHHVNIMGADRLAVLFDRVLESAAASRARASNAARLPQSWQRD